MFVGVSAFVQFLKIKTPLYAIVYHKWPGPEAWLRLSKLYSGLKLVPALSFEHRCGLGARGRRRGNRVARTAQPSHTFFPLLITPDGQQSEQGGQWKRPGRRLEQQIQGEGQERPLQVGCPRSARSLSPSNLHLSDGDLVKLFETQGEDAVLSFAEENIEPMLYENGPRLIGAQEYQIWKTTMVSPLLGPDDDLFR